MTENQYGQAPQTVLISVDKLTKHPANEDLRYILDEDFARLRRSIKKMISTGYFNARPILVSDRTGKYVIMAGNHRYEAAKAEGFKEVPCKILSGLSEAEELDWLMTDNGQYAKHDHDAMSSLFEPDQLAEWGIHVPVVFSDAELETTDFGDKNQEVDVAGFSDKMVLKFEFAADEFAAVKTALAKTGKTPEGFLFDSLAPFMK